MHPKSKELPLRHTIFEDFHALLAGTAMVSLGVVLYLEAQIYTGGLAGLSLLIEYATGWNFGLIFFCVNIPFYALSLMRMGWLFTVKTFMAVALISLFSKVFSLWIDISSVDPIFSSVVGGTVIGAGMIFLFRHRAGVGGSSILAQFLQDKKIMRAGYFMLGFDTIILCSGFFVLPWKQVLVSILGAFVLNVIIAINHKPGRYAGFSE
ncbi:YitT family protein [Hirschia maritima]|uniref:YitT family protein n=1 Tax=Hirschia maritima TaxID=1121961 RepID=UPI00037D383D|nr:YitT family protein [Hirschia maritima]